MRTATPLAFHDRLVPTGIAAEYTAAAQARLNAQAAARRNRPPSDRKLRERMVREIERATTLHGNVTRRDLRRAGFTELQIDEHFDAALGASRAQAMVD